MEGPAISPPNAEVGPYDTELELDPQSRHQYEEEEEEQEEEGGVVDESVTSLSIELGDIIKIIAPSNSDIHDNIFLVDYVSQRRIRLINTDKLNEHILNIDATGNLTDESITNIELLSRAEERGYARQNHLVVSTWVDIRFGGDLPTVITGLITDLEEDMIEIRTYPEDEMIYINFAYMGIPEELPIEEIKIRQPPASFGKGAEGAEYEESGLVVLPPAMSAAISAASGPRSDVELPVKLPSEESSPSMALTPTSREERRKLRMQENIASSFGKGENAVDQPIGLSDATAAATAALPIQGKSYVAPADVREKLKSIILDADQIQFGDTLDVLVQTVDIPDENRRFNLEKQCDDLMDTLITNVPASEKTRHVLTNIQRMVERFKELRHKFSDFDTNGNPSIPKPKSATHRPLVEALVRMNKSLQWIIPIVKTRKVIYDIPIDSAQANEMDIEPRLFQEERDGEIELQKQWYDGSITYTQYMTNLSNIHFTSQSEPRNKQEVISTKQVSDNFTAVIDNLDDLYSSVVINEKVKRRRFVIQKYNLGVSKLQLKNLKGGAKMAADFVPLTQNDRMNITGFMTFPEPVMYYSRISLPNTNILDKCNLNMQYVHYWDMLRQNMTIATHEVSDLKEPIDMNSHNFLSNIKQFVLDPSLDDRDKYRKFLEVVIPKTKNIFEMMRRYIHGRLTLQDVLSYIEPFLVYQEDLNVKQYDEIVSFLFERVLEYKRNYATNYRKFSKLRAYKYHVRYIGVSFLYKLIVTGKMMDADVFKAYGFQDTQVRSGGTAGSPGQLEGMDARQRQQLRGRAYAAGLSDQTDYNDNLLSSSELLSKMLAVDYAKLYMDAVAITTTDLITPFDFNLVLGEQSSQLQKAGAMRGPGAEAAGAAEEGGAAAGSGSGAPKRFGLVLAKSYPHEDAIREDNDSDLPIYFDKKYDTTDYAFIESYRENQETMSESDFKAFLTDELIKNKKMSMSAATAEAEALMTGPGLRPVKDGDYAVVEVNEYIEPEDRPRFESENTGELETRYLYFKRENGKWVRDESIPAIVPSSDRDYFCNVDRDCIPLAIAAASDLMAQQGPGSGLENVTSKDGSAAIKKAFLDKMKGEFDAKYQVTRENFTEFVNRKFDYDLKNIDRIAAIQNKEFYKYNDKKYQIGVHSLIKRRTLSGDEIRDYDEEDEDIEAIISPMEPLKDKILAQSDFVKRQYDTLQFITSFTRKANEIMGEDTNWLYCIKSNAKLMPSFYETIAIAFIQSHGGGGGGGGGAVSGGIVRGSAVISLNVVIDTICKERGTISDDGEAWIDKYSGAIIKQIEHITEEGFDESGFKLVTRDIIEADAGDKILKVAKPASASASASSAAAGGLAGVSIVAKYDSPNAKIINNIVTTMTGYMGIDLHEEREFIIQNTLTLMETSVPPEEAYKARSERMFREKGKHLPPYKDTFFQTLLLLTLSHLIIAIQCAIPVPKTRKTHAGCIRSFSGYPLDGEGDTSGMMYVACIAYKIKTSIEPWNTLKSFKKETDILAKLKTMIDTLIMPKTLIKERLQTKRDYLAQGRCATGEAIPAALSIDKWGNYLPPMKSLDNMPTPQNVAADFANQLITDMKRGYHGQHDKLNVLETKSLYFSLSIQQMIHEVVKNSSPLLMNMANDPFLENACCNEETDRRSVRTIDYFMAKAQNIHHHNRIIGFLEKTAREMVVLTRPSILMDNRNTRFNYPEIQADFNEQTIYRAFIAYCKLNHSISSQRNAASAGESAAFSVVAMRANPNSTALHLIPEIRDLCPERPDDWNPTDAIEDKIRKLKRSSNLYDKNSLDRLLHAINSHNMVDASYKKVTNRPTEPMQFQRFRDAILHLNRKYEEADNKEDAFQEAARRSSREGEGIDIGVGLGMGMEAEDAVSMLDRCIIPSKLRRLIIANMDTMDKTVQEDTEEMRDIKNYLHSKNSELKTGIFTFLQQNGKQTKAKVREIETLMNTIMTFEINQSNGVLMSSLDETAVKSIQFMKSSINRLIDVIPSVILRGVDFDNTNIPKHWGFSDTHMKDVKQIISSHYTSLKKFYNDNVVKEVIRHASQHVKDIKQMMENTPFMAEIFFDEVKDARIAEAAAALATAPKSRAGAGGAIAAMFIPQEVDIVVPESESGGRVPHSTRKNIFTTYSIFDRDIVKNLYLFYFLSLMQTYIYLVIETPITIYQSEPTKVIRKSAKSAKGKNASKKRAMGGEDTASMLPSGKIARAADHADKEEEEADDIEPEHRLHSAESVRLRDSGTISEMDIILGNKKALGEKVAELLIAYLRIIEKDKSSIDFNYANIKEKLTRVKDKEKDGVVERIGAMSMPERQLENMMKVHKMGIWSRGTSQTGVVIYDQDYYDEEREEMEKIAQKERQLGKRDYVTDMNREIYVMDALEEDRIAAEIEDHELDMRTGIPEDDDAGDDDGAFIHRHDDEGEGFEGGGVGSAGGADWED